MTNSHAFIAACHVILTNVRSFMTKLFHPATEHDNISNGSNDFTLRFAVFAMRGACKNAKDSALQAVAEIFLEFGDKV